MAAGRLACVLACLTVVCFLAFRVLSSTPVLGDSLVSDELYYVTAARYILYRLGLAGEFTPPFEVEVAGGDGTIVVYATLHGGFAVVDLVWSEWHWLNPEHPLTGKLVYGLILSVCGCIARARLVVLAFSLASLGVLVYTLTRRCGVGVAVCTLPVLAVDWVYVHLTYLLVLDTLVLALLLYSLAAAYRGRYSLALAPLTLACSVKGFAVVYAIAYTLFYALLGRWRLALAATTLPLLALAAGYAGNLAFAEPGEVVEAIRNMMGVVDPLAHRRLWLLGVWSEWGVFRLFTPLVWVWFAGVASLALTRRRINPVDALPYLLTLTCIIAVTLLACVRAVYPYYYATAVALSPIPLWHTVTALATLHRRQPRL